MRHKVIRMTLDPESIQNAIDEIEKQREWAVNRAKDLAKALMDEGLEVARMEFRTAVYDGDNDVTVTARENGSIYAVVATGFSTLFIEFGTGVTYPDDHPLMSEFGFERGTYGKGHGKQQFWGYYGEPGTNGVVRDPDRMLVITRGNPANQSMYKTAKHLEYLLPRLVKEIFV